MKKGNLLIKSRLLKLLVFLAATITLLSVFPCAFAEENEEEEQNNPPIAISGRTYNSFEGIEVFFDGSASLDPDGDPLIFRWNFDGTWTPWSSSPYAYHTWFDDWSGIITLEVSDELDTSSDTALVTIDNADPQIYFEGKPYFEVEKNQEFELTIEFFDPDPRSFCDDTYTALFEWGDTTITEEYAFIYERDVTALHTYSQLGEYTIFVTITDDDGGSSTAEIFVDVFGIDLGGAAQINEGEIFNYIGAFYLLDGEATYALVDYGDGAGPEPLTIIYDEYLELNHQYLDNGIFIVTVELYDFIDELIGFESITVTVNNIAPEIISMNNLPTDPIPSGSLVELNSDFTDPGILDTHIATINWGDETITTGIIVDNTITATHTFIEPGVFTITITLEDDDGGIDTEIHQYVVVFDPNEGFVTGGGWINSPEGAYKPDLTLTGKANFGFVSKYKKGQTTPTGNTQFQFQAGDINFHSSSYDWLVIAGSKAMYKGIGTINGEGNYGFMISAIDGDLKGDNEDKFRIKIWDKDTDELIYDNNINGDDYDDPSTVLGGGQIVIHKK